MNRVSRIAAEVEDLLYFAATSRRVVDVEAWDYGWGSSDYRRSDDAALHGRGCSIALSADGVQALESAVELLLRDKSVRNAWEEREFWPLVANGVASISMECDPEALRQEVRRRTRLLLEPGKVLAALPMANVNWDGDPIRIGDAVIGRIGDDWVSLVNAVSGQGIQDEMAFDWVRKISDFSCFPQGASEQGVEALTEDDHSRHVCGARFPRKVPVAVPVVFATWSRLQGEKAIEEASALLDQVVDLALLLEAVAHRDDVEVSRSAYNRPAVRGHSLDRLAIEHAVGASRHADELAVHPLLVSVFGSRGGISWATGDPLSLSSMLRDGNTIACIEKIIGERLPVSARLAVASRWYSRAHWAEQDVDAVLSLGIAVDALIGDKSGLPGRALSERFGLLEDDPRARPARASGFQEIYQVRSAVAHGSLTSTRIDKGFRARMVREVAWGASRLLEMEKRFSPESEAEFRDVFEGLRWGTIRW